MVLEEIQDGLTKIRFLSEYVEEDNEDYILAQIENWVVRNSSYICKSGEQRI